MSKVKEWGDIIIVICIIVEMCIWPSFENLAGCIMTSVCWLIFSRVGLNESVIREHFFAWLVFVSMSLYRILPLIATMIEGHSIGYNFEVPFDTYFGETVLYLISALAFYLAINRKQSLGWLKKLLFKSGFYNRISDNMLWAFGGVGLVIRLYLMSYNVQFGDVIGKTLSGFTFFQYAPLLLFFPSLYKLKVCNNISVNNRWALLYFIFLIILSLATNSRYAILEPFGTIVLLFLLSYLQTPYNFRQDFDKKYIICGCILVIFLVPFVSDISLAMLANRGIRGEVNKVELFKKTIDTYLDQNKMDNLRRMKDIKERKERESLPIYSETWSETYVRNFALNRYCNLKVSDNTLYHAEKVGFANKQMQNDFWKEIVALLPTPILKQIGVDYDKNKVYSRGDKLKAMSANRSPFASYLVTSHLADGLVTFGYFYFPIEFILFFIRFLFLDTFLIKYEGRVYYSIFGLITIFSFLAMFRNAGGCCDSLPYLLRGYWQDVILFIIGFFLLRKISTATT